jgi:HJR/Mrr/RecB family endonuclease
VGFVIRDLILSKEGKKVRFNIKESLSNFTGEGVEELKEAKSPSLGEDIEGI